MEDETPNFWAHLRRTKFRRICLLDPTGEQANASTEAEIPFTTVPYFSTRSSWHLPTTAAFEFLRRLPLISVSTLPEGKRRCDICYEPYMSGAHPEKPCRLPCQHVLGRRCIGKWILPQETQPNTTCPICRSELFSNEVFMIPLTSPSEEGDAADWVRETSLSYEGDPNAEERMELLVKEIQRVGSTTSEWPTAATEDFMRGFLSEHSDTGQGHESSLAGLLSQIEMLARDGGEFSSEAERAALDQIRRILPQAREAVRELHTTMQRLSREHQRFMGPTARVHDGEVEDGNS